MRRLLLILLILLSPTPALAKGGVVSSADRRASEAGRLMLRQGGNAVDAALAMMLALTVVEPQSSGIGGGGFLVHHDGATGALATIDGRETAPTSANPRLFLDADGKPRPFMEVWPGGYSTGVPGNMQLMAQAHARWGKLPWGRLFQPAIKLARGGFEVSAPLARALDSAKGRWDNYPATRALYFPGGGPAKEGERIRNPALAKLLQTLARKGADAFYTGANAAAITKAVGEAPNNPTALTGQDLAGYRAKDRPPVCGKYRAWKVCGMGPPSSGAVTVLQVLGMLERFDLKAMGKDDPRSWNLIGDAMRLAYADREKYLGDPDFVTNPVAGMIDPAYLATRSGLIRPDKALGKYEAGDPPGAPKRTAAVSSEVAGTTHFIAIDGAGGIVSYTSTVESSFGSQLVANGFVLNNELTDFTFAPEKDGAPVANRVEAGKRPLSSMAPTIVYDADDKPVFVVGAAGGKTIIMQVAKAIIAHFDWGLSAREALGLPLLFFNNDGLVIEGGTPLEAVKPALEKMGQTFGTPRMSLKANAAERMPDGSWQGAADPRSVGVALSE